MGLETLPKIITDIYKLYDQLNLSVTSLVVIGLVLTFAFLLAAREAAAWFFKIDDVKKDVRKLRQVIIDLEGEMRSLQGLLNQNLALANSAANENATFKTTLTEAARISKPAETTAPSKPAPNANFPINH